LGLDRDRRIADPHTLNMRSYLIEIAANDSNAVGYMQTVVAKLLKNRLQGSPCGQSFFAIALNIGFFLCYFRRRVEYVGKLPPAFANTF
jgi:hypothetical protein